MKNDGSKEARLSNDRSGKGDGEPGRKGTGEEPNEGKAEGNSFVSSESALGGQGRGQGGGVK